TAGKFYDVTGTRRAFVRDRNGNFIVPPANEITEVAGINDRGDIAGYYVDQAHNIGGFLLTKDGVAITLNVPGAEGTGVNDREQRVGTLADPAQGGKIGCCVWDPTGKVPVLVVPNWTAPYAYSINNRGEVSGGFDVTGPGSKRGAFVYKTK